MIPEANVTELQAAVNADVQEAYCKLMEDYKFNHLQDMEKATGVKLDIDKKRIRAIYKQILLTEDRFDDFDSRKYYVFEDLQNAIGVDIGGNLARECYKQFFEKGLLHDIRELHRKTGVKPKRVATAVQKYYAKLFDDQSPSIILEMYELTKVRPKNIKDEDIQETYESCLWSGDFEQARKIRRITGVKPNLPDYTVQRLYRHHSEGAMLPRVRIFWLEEAEKIKKFTGIGISEREAEIIYDSIFERKSDLDKREFQHNCVEARDLMIFSGIPPHQEILDKHNIPEESRQFILRGNSK